jgi:hypothetical protein
LNGKVTILKVVGIDSSPAYLSPPAAGDPCNKVMQFSLRDYAHIDHGYAATVHMRGLAGGTDDSTVTALGA